MGLNQPSTPSTVPSTVIVTPPEIGPASSVRPTPTESPTPNTITGEKLPLVGTGTRSEVAPSSTPK